ncbi:L-rhamnose mutarotase [Fulvivirga sp. M361]|uniref:L-rhamnose mutarotase n=1 Tax=Fulvivirga sp. M361 TaxID=2594266 RepID=UPI00351B9DE1
MTLDLKNDPLLIARYKQHHKNVWPEIKDSIVESGILSMEIYNIHTRLFMIIEVDASFSFDKKRLADATNEKVQEWEQMMDTYQQRLPFSRPNEKWLLMDKIFEL